MINLRSFDTPAILRGLQRRVLLPGLLLGTSSVLLLSGCSSAFNPGLSAAAEGALSGKVHGGQYPVQGSIVSLYEVNTTTGAGYGASLGSALAVSSPTNAQGQWSIGSFTCAHSTDELLLVAVGGDPLNDSQGTSNTALVMTSVAGPCNGLFATNFNIDEVTTVATEYALAGFSTGYTHVGTSAGNLIGLKNAFATVINLVNLSTGQALTKTPSYQSAPANTSPDTFSSIVPNDTINALANTIATCVNTASGASSACTTLFSYAGGSQSLASGNGVNNSPNAGSTLNTADAVLYIAHNPGLPASSGFAGNNVAAVVNLGGGVGAPFGPSLASTPDDLTLTLNFVSGGLGGVRSSTWSKATQLAIDESGNVWVPNPARNSVTKLTNLGAPITNSTTLNLSSPFALIAAGGYTGIGLTNAGALAIDQNGKAWIADYNNCLVGLSTSGSPLASSPFTGACPNSGAAGIAVDASNNIWVAGISGGSSFISETNNSGAAQGSPFTLGLNTLTGFLGADYAGNIWYTDKGNGNFGSVGAHTNLVTGILASPSGFSAIGPFTGSGNNGGLSLWIPEGTGVQAIQPVNLTGTISTIPGGYYPATEYGPVAIAVDGNGNYYLTNFGNSGLGIPANVTVVTKAESQVSPNSTGYNGGSGYVSLNQPQGIAIDQSGNVWVVNGSNYNSTSHSSGPYAGQYLGNGSNAANLTEFVGLAAPTNPVFSLDAANSTYGVKP